MIRRVLKSFQRGDRDGGTVDRMIVGLGNPGPKYAETRHNLGSMTVEEIARRLGAADRERRRFEAVIIDASSPNGRVALARPTTMMNNSGHAVSQLARWYRLQPADILVVHDELDLPFGRIRLRPGGGPGGHNGVRSVIEQLGTADFPRLRIGIGRPVSGSTISYVLSRFRREEQERVPAVVSLAADAAICWLDQGLDAAMNEYNRREVVLAGPASGGRG